MRLRNQNPTGSYRYSLCLASLAIALSYESPCGAPTAAPEGEHMRACHVPLLRFAGRAELETVAKPFLRTIRCS